MNLEFIKTIECPVCGCSTVVKESVEFDYGRREIRQHCNGGHWEVREFACGYIVKFTPNYLKEEYQNLCRYDPNKLKRKKLDVKFYKGVYKYLMDTNVNTEERSKLINLVSENITRLESEIRMYSK